MHSAHSPTLGRCSNMLQVTMVQSPSCRQLADQTRMLVHSQQHRMAGAI